MHTESADFLSAWAETEEETPTYLSGALIMAKVPYSLPILGSTVQRTYYFLFSCFSSPIDLEK